MSSNLVSLKFSAQSHLAVMRLTNFDTRLNHNFNAGRMLPIEIASDFNLFNNLPQNIFNKPPPTWFNRKKVLHPFSSNYLHVHKNHKNHKKKEKSWLDMLNPFECESDYEDEDDDDNYEDD